MIPTCRKCLYYCKVPFEHNVYNFSYSFCGLHGCEEILDPDGTPPNLMHKQNDNYDCMCGFFPLHLVENPIQLSLFD